MSLKNSQRQSTRKGVDNMKGSLPLIAGVALCAAAVSGCVTTPTNNVAATQSSGSAVHPAKGIILGDFAQDIAASKAVKDVQTPPGISITAHTFINATVVFNHKVSVIFDNGVAHDISEAFQPSISRKEALAKAQAFFPEKSTQVGSPVIKHNPGEIVYTYTSQKFKRFVLTFKLDTSGKVSKVNEHLNYNIVVSTSGNPTSQENSTK
jgi:hypothetical protein